MNKKSITPFLDFLFLMLFTFIIMVILSKNKEGEPALPPNVVYQIVMDWPGESKTDMDLWAKSPDNCVVGFNRREGGDGSLLSLAHDDLGARNDTSGKDVIKVNQEIISIRGTHEGEYIVNAHCYLKNKEEKEIPVSIKLVKVKPFKEIVLKERVFTLVGEEQTFFRFTLDKDGNVSNVNDLQQKIASLVSEEEFNQADTIDPQSAPQPEQ